MRGMLLVATVVGAVVYGGTFAEAANLGAREMQAQRQGQRQGGAMTAQRARRECWQQFGVSPGSPRNAYRSSLQPQVEACVTQKMRR